MTDVLTKAIKEAVEAGTVFQHAADCDAWQTTPGSSLKRMDADSRPCSCYYSVLVGAGVLEPDPWTAREHEELPT